MASSSSRPTGSGDGDSEGKGEEKQMKRPQSPPSPSASFYDMSDDSEGDYNTVKSAKSGKGVKLLYSKSKVYVHPTPSAKDNIPGYIALVQQKPAPAEAGTAKPPSSSLLLAWVPETSLGNARDAYVRVDLSGTESPPKQSFLVPPPPSATQYTLPSSANGGTGTSTAPPLGYAFSIPLSSVYSILIRPPSLGWWFGSVVVNTRAGASLPALFFHDNECESTILQQKKRTRESFDPFGDHGDTFWGGDEVLRWLRRYVEVTRTDREPNIYLVDPTEEDKVGFGAGGLPPGTVDKNASSSSGNNRNSRTMDAAMDPITKALKGASWNFLEKMSQVTTFTRRQAQAIRESPNVPTPVKKWMASPEVQNLQDEFDAARIYLARWAMSIAEQSDKDRRQRLFTQRDVLELEESELGEFELLDAGMDKLSLEKQRKPVTLEEWKGWFNASSGRLQVTPLEVKERIFHGGLDAEDGVRKEAWLFLLGVYDWDSSAEERAAVMNSRRDDYIRLKGSWWERLAEGAGTAEEAEWWKEQKNRIEKDVHRTDRQVLIFAGEDIPHPDPDSPFADVGTNAHMEQMKDMLLTYNEYNPNLGYVQGMSDLLAPIYAVMQDDAVAFWAFVGFMDRMERNFLRDQSGMRTQLMALDQLVQLLDPKLYTHLEKADSTNFFFFFRMILVWFKREFEWLDVLRLWEGLWTDYYSSSFHLFIAVAILEKHRTVIMEHLQHFDEVLKYINELSNTIDLESTLIRAEQLFQRFQRLVDAIDKKNNFPTPSSAPVRQRRLGPGPDSTVGDSASANANAVGTTSASSARDTAQRPSGAQPAPQVSTGGEAVNTTEPEKKKVITPQLRALLSRQVEKLEKKDLKKHGGGVN